MIKLKFAAALLVVLLSISVRAEEGGNSEAVSMLVMAKTSGMCGVLSQMARFQQSTKMSGGDEFLERFINTEMSRLGFTLESFIGYCAKSTEAYQSYMDIFNSDRG